MQYVTPAPGSGQTATDLTTEPAGVPVYVKDVYYAPAAWCETTVDPMTGGDVTKLKSGYLTPDGLYAYRHGLHSTAPNPAQLEPIDPAEFVQIEPHRERSKSDFGSGKSVAWTSQFEKARTGYVPKVWANMSGTIITDTMSGAGIYPMMSGYLTPGVIDLLDRNSVTTVTPPAVTSTNAGYTLPATEGTVWTVDGEEVEPGTYAPDTTAGPVTVTILPTPAAGYAYDPPAEATILTFEPDPEPEPEPEGDTGETDGVRMMGLMLRTRPDDTEGMDELAGAYHIVRLFVQEYTRGKGFTPAGRPVPGLLGVIVSGAVRLAVNPEQAVMYQLDGVTVRPAVFNGYTLAEQRVLHNYRRRYA